MAFQKEHLVIFFNPLQLEIQNTIIKLQLLWLPTFVPAAVSDALALHIQSQLPPPPPPPPPFRGFCFIAASTISGLQMCSAQLAVQQQSTRNVLLKSLFAFRNKTLCTFPHMWLASEFHNRKNGPCPLALYPIVFRSWIDSFLMFSFFPALKRQSVMIPSCDFVQLFHSLDRHNANRFLSASFETLPTKCFVSICFLCLFSGD